MGAEWDPFRAGLESLLSELERTNAEEASALLGDFMKKALASPAGAFLEKALPADLLEEHMIIRRRSSGGEARSSSKLRDGLRFLESTTSSLSSLLRRPAVGSRSDPSTDTAQPVDMAVFGPAAVPPGATFLLQVWAYPPEAEDQVESRALQADADAERRAFHALKTRLAEGETIDVYVEIDGFEIDEPEQSFLWAGRPDARQVAVIAPDAPLGTTIGRVSVAVGGTPVGTLRFKIDVDGATADDDADSLATAALRYRRGFVSYSSRDRAEVLRRVQGMRAAGIRVFQDVLDLDPGDRWEQELYREIDECDVFFLFWSKHASESKWVLKEVEYALDRQQQSEAESPDIAPVPIEGPPIELPPPCLQHLHFNDALLAHIAVSEPSS